MGVEPTAACRAARRAVLKTGGSTGIQPSPTPSIPDRKWIVKAFLKYIRKEGNKDWLQRQQDRDHPQS